VRALSSGIATVRSLAAGLGFCLATLAASGSSVTNCTREALVNALVQGGVVNYTNDCALQLTNAIVITNDVALTSAGFSVNLSATNSRVFMVSSGVNFTVNGIKFASALSTNGGAFHIDSGATVVLGDCTFSANLAVGADGFSGDDADTNAVVSIGHDGGRATAGDPGLGGAIFNLGTLICSNCAFVGNRAFGGYGGDGGAGGAGTYQGGNGGNGGAAATAQGGAIYSLGSLYIDSCTFSSNTVSGGNGGSGGAAGSGPFAGWPGKGGTGASGSGAAIWSSNLVSVVNSALIYNLAFGGDSATGGTSGGGIGTDGAKGGDAFGGGLAIYAAGGLTNCTFYGNYVRGGQGGQGGPGSYAGGNGGNGGASIGAGVCNLGTLTVMSCTLAGNGAQGGTNGAGGSGPFTGVAGSTGVARGANLANSAGTVQLKNTILGLTLIGPSGYGTITDLGFNICGDKSLTLKGTSTNNLDPKLSVPGTNGGLTVTMLPLPGSYAPNHGDMAGTLSRDQRGLPRPNVAGDLPDIGAVEGRLPIISTQPADLNLSLGSPATLTVTATGEAPLLYRWKFNGTNLPAATGTNATLTIAALASNQFGPYLVVVSNAFGVSTSRVATISRLITGSTLAVSTLLSNQFSILFSTTAGSTYRLEYKNALTDTNWITSGTFTGTGGRITNRIVIGTNRSGFYRVVAY